MAAIIPEAQRLSWAQATTAKFFRHVFGLSAGRRNIRAVAISAHGRVGKAPQAPKKQPPEVAADCSMTDLDLDPEDEINYLEV